jgi:SAM-dependent methyltransferase
MVACKNCGLIFLNPRPAPNELPRLYTDDYIPYRFDVYLPPIVNNLRMWTQRKKVHAIKNIVSRKATIFDVGCGGGFFLDCLKRYGSPDWTLVGIDVSSAATSRVAERGFPTHLGRFETLPLDDETADVIILNQVIEHLDDPLSVLSKAFRILKPGGILFIETPNVDGLDARIFLKRYWGGWHFPRHWTLYSHKSLTDAVKRCGFSVVRTESLLSPNFWAQSFHHWLLERKWNRVAGFFDCKNLLVMCAFSAVDMLLLPFKATSNMRLIARR